MATNEYGLDCEYFKKNLKQITRDIERYTPSEMFRTMQKLMMVAAEQAKFDVKLEVGFLKPKPQ